MRNSDLAGERRGQQWCPAAGGIESAVGSAAHTALLDLAPDAIFARDADRRIIFWNRGAESTYGSSSAEALGVVPGELLQTEYPIPLEEIERLAAESGG